MQQILQIAILMEEIAAILTQTLTGVKIVFAMKIWIAMVRLIWLEMATAMIKQCEHECQMRGASEVRLSVYAMNEAGMGLYRSLGYEINSYSLKKNLNPTGWTMNPPQT